MVLYGVYSEPLLKRHYSTIFSYATVFQVVTYALIFVPPVFIAYVTNDLWRQMSSYREQPKVKYLDQVVAVLGGEGGELEVWGAAPEFTDLLQPPVDLIPDVNSLEVDDNRDGRADVLNITIEFPGLFQAVTSVQLLLFFQVEMKLFPSVVMQSLVHFTHSWSSPPTCLWLGGELALSQQALLPGSGRYNKYNESLFNGSSLAAGEFELASILREYSRRDLTTVLFPFYPVWKNDSTGGFRVEAEIRYTEQTILYRPGFWQQLKFAWVQYVAIALVFWWALHRVQSFVFQNQIIITVKQHTD